MNLSTIPKSDLQEELGRREGVVYRGGFKHKAGCDSSVVNPITEWCGGSEVVITGYKCTKCGVVTKIKLDNCYDSPINVHTSAWKPERDFNGTIR